MPIFDYRGHSLAWESYGAGQNTVLFIHGLGGHGKSWMYQINHFKKNNRVITIDLFGHGQSAKDIDPVFVPRLDAEAIMALVESEIKEPIWAVGHSFASVILPEMIKLDRPLLKGIAFVDCTYQGFKHIIDARMNFARLMLGYDDATLAPKADKWYDDLIGPGVDQSMVSFIKSSLKYCNLRWLFESVAGCREYNQKHPPQQTPVYPDLPIFVIEADHGIGDNFAKSWVNHFKQARYYLLENAWHFFFVTHHEIFNRLIEEFMTTDGS